MPEVSTAMLFSPPHPPVQIRDPGVIVGRSRGCDLRVSSSDASRRHAEIIRRGDDYVLRDLGSTNGTFVNGDRIETRDLQAGDTIEIGGHRIAFCAVVGSEAPADRVEAQTVLSERPGGGAVFHGDLSKIPPFAVLQMLELGRHTGVLQVNADTAAGRLWLREGAPVHAETDKQSGFDAAITIAHARTGHFDFESEAAVPEVTITASVTELLLEASRQLDEAGIDSAG